MAVSRRRLLRGRRWRGLFWRRWRRWRRRWISVGRSRGGEPLRFFPRQRLGDLVDRRRLFIVIGRGPRVVARGLDLDQTIGDAALRGDRKVRRPRRWRGDNGDEFFERAESFWHL